MVSLWNELATSVGQELHDIADKSPVVAIKSLKVGDFQGNLMSNHVFQKHFLDFIHSWVVASMLYEKKFIL